MSTWLVCRRERETLTSKRHSCMCRHEPGHGTVQKGENPKTTQTPINTECVKNHGKKQVWARVRRKKSPSRLLCAATVEDSVEVTQKNKK